MFLRSYLFTFLTFLLSLTSLSASAQEDVIIVKVASDWQSTPVETARLYPIGNNQYVGTITDALLIILEYNNVYFRADKNLWGTSPIGSKITLQKDSWGYIQLKPEGNRYKLRATLSSDKNSIDLEFLAPDPPKPITATINSVKTTLVDDVANVSTTYTVDKPLNTSKKAVSVGALSFEGTTYGVASQPSFSESASSQTQTLKLVSGSTSGFTLSAKGYYMLSVRTVDGTPAELIIRKLAADEEPNTPLSATFPEAMLGCTNSASYIPDEALTLWTNEEGYGKNPVDVGNYGANYSNVFLLGNGRLGMATGCDQSEGILINEKTNYDSNP
ncbi:MAG: hypothetical protein K2F88_08065, partial [Duncaniella sp.]|nr:hypothetical protein [Duncaniella sp.]